MDEQREQDAPAQAFAGGRWGWRINAAAVIVDMRAALVVACAECSVLQL